jgi:hypothetical protein
MNILTHIRNIIFLWHENKKEKVMSNLNLKNLLYVTKSTYKKKNSWVRNQVALLIKRWRKENPYKIVDYSKAKALYENTIPIDLSKVKVGSYVVKYSEDCPVKGKRWCEYYVNFSSGIGIFKVTALNNLVSYRGESSYRSLNEEWSRSFRFATKEEIEEFKIARKNYKQKKKEIEVLQKQISKLYKELW